MNIRTGRLLSGFCYHMNILNKLLQNIIDLIFPSNCFGCGIEGVWLCKDCIEKIPILNKNNCFWCNNKDNNICFSCQQESKLSALFVITAYQNPLFQDMLHNLKYNFASSIGDTFKLLLIKYFEQNKIDIINKDSVIVPIPLHRKRLAERGFNQSELIGNHIAEILQLKINPKLLIRKKNTKSQMTLNRADRILNMQKSFVCPDPTQIKGKDIILIDDVLTTGTTIRDAAQALRASGCRSVSAIVLAKGGLINMKDNVRID